MRIDQDERMGATRCRRSVWVLVACAGLVVGYFMFFGDYLQFSGDPQFDDRRYRLTDFMNSREAISLHLAMADTDHVFSPNSDSFKRLLEVLDCTVQTSRHRTRKDVREIRGWGGSILIQQSGLTICQLYPGGFVDLPRTDGNLELCRADRFVFIEVTKFLEALSER